VVVSQRYGLAGGGPPLTFAQIGAGLGCSGEWARQLHWAALVWLRQPAHSQVLRSWLDRHTVADYRWAEAHRWLAQRGGRHGRHFRPCFAAYSPFLPSPTPLLLRIGPGRQAPLCPSTPHACLLPAHLLCLPLRNPT